MIHLIGVVLAAFLAGPVIRLEEEGGVRTFRVEGAGGAGDFALFVDAGLAEPPAVLGSRRFENGALVFTPRFPLQAGLRYRAEFRASGRDPVTAVFEIPRVDALPTTAVEQIYPTASRWPENQLKFYIHFSAPMSRGEAYRRLRLLDGEGRPVELPFLELEEELWDREGTRLTILFDPGRVKRDLVPHEEAGTPLRAGNRYTLVIDQSWPDSSGKPLVAEHRKSVEVGPPDRDPPRPDSWRVQPPRAGSRDALTVEFPEPLDSALLLRVLRVTDRKGASVAGSAEIDQEETRWRFVPSERWTPGDYDLHAANILEDLAGNSIGRPFEVDVFDRVQERITHEETRVGFRVAP